MKSRSRGSISSTAPVKSLRSAHKTKPRAKKNVEFALALPALLFVFLSLRVYYGSIDEKKADAQLQGLKPTGTIQSRQSQRIHQPLVSYGDLSAKNSSFAFDIVSVGSLARLSYQQTQQSLFASHPSVRHFFNITELDDADPHCTDLLEERGAVKVSRFCRHRKKWDPKQFVMSYLRHHYSSAAFLRKKVSPQGWVCAQTRPTFGFHRAIRYYQESGSFPDYLLIIDDDTYVNLDLIEGYLSTLDSNIPRAIAGCMVRSPIHDINLTIPFGGYGMFFSKAAVSNYMRPLRCTSSDQDEFTISACRRLRENQIGEYELFREGMSVADIQLAYARHQPFANYSTWTTGFCLHSDWAWGFFSNFYNLTKHVDDPFYADVPHSRMDGYMGSELYAGKKVRRRKGKDQLGICVNEGDNCDETSHICHYQSPEKMKRLVQLTSRS